MKFSKALIGAALSLSVGLVAAENDYPILLIHGFGGSTDSWDYETELQEAGALTLNVDVGKVTSHWKRACDAYAQVKGTVTDYGACHSEEYGHSRYGADYTGLGLYEDWSEENPIHVMGHSMGGQTARMLEYLLREGSGCADDTSELFTGGHNGIYSITTLSGVLDGTTLIDSLDSSTLLGLLKAMVVGALGSVDDSFIDDDMEYWGIAREDGEKFSDFWDRVAESGVLSPDHEDIGTYDLSTEGSIAFNSIATQAYSDTYYFSYATEYTNERSVCFFGWCWYWQAADWDMTWYLIPIAYYMGHDDDVSKQENDGLVNWDNQLCPTVTDDDKDNCVEFSSDFDIGVWNYIDVGFLDHFQIIVRDDDNDSDNYSESAKRIYVNHGARLLNL